MTWNPFSRTKKTDETDQSEAELNQAESETKGHATPKRKDAEARSLRPLVPDPKDRKVRIKQERARIRERQNAEYEAMQRGDVAHMPRAERNPVRVYIRQYVDARWNLSEFFIPFALVGLVGSLFLSALSPMISLVVAGIMYVYLFAIVIDMIIMWRGLKKKMMAKWNNAPAIKAARGMSYAMSRALQLRRFRLPKPTSKKRGNYPK